MITSRTEKDLVFVDCETTGLVAGYHEIIDVAAIRTSPDGLTIRETYTAKVHPDHMDRFEEEARQVNGYAPGEWNDDPHLEERAKVAVELARVTNFTNIVAHNVAFDAAFVENLIREHGNWKRKFAPWDYHKVCTVVLAWPLYRKGVLSSLRLKDVCEGLGIPPEPDTHRALNGANACRSAYLKLMERYGLN